MQPRRNWTASRTAKRHRRTDQSDCIGATPMTMERAFSLLGLPRAADRSRVRAAYRRLAFEHHPDRNPRDLLSFERFKQITLAFRFIEDSFILDEQDPTAGECDRCGRYAPLRRSLNHNRYCRWCLLTIAGRLGLPAPPVIIASCTMTLVLLAAAICLLFVASSSKDAGYGIAAFLLGLMALVCLAFTAITVSHAAEPPRRTRRRRRLRRLRQRPNVVS